MATGIGTSDVSALPSEITDSDLLLIARDNVIYSVATRDMPSRFTARRQMAAPQLSDFPTVVNFAGYADVTQLDDGIRIFVDRRSSGNNLRGRFRPLPAAPWDVALGFVKGFRHGNCFGGIALRESATGKLLFQSYGANTLPGWFLQSYTNPSTFSASISSREERGLGVAWFRFLLNGSTIESYISADGVAWKQMHTAHPLTTSFTTTPDQWGFYLNNQSGLPCWLDVIDWKE
jgi:hypothetical protein